MDLHVCECSLRSKASRRDQVVHPCPFRCTIVAYLAVVFVNVWSGVGTVGCRGKVVIYAMYDLSLSLSEVLVLQEECTFAGSKRANWKFW